MSKSRSNITLYLAALLLSVCAVVSCGKVEHQEGRRQIKARVNGVQTRSSVLTTERLENGGHGAFTMHAVIDEPGRDEVKEIDYPAGNYFTETVVNSVEHVHQWTLEHDQYWFYQINTRFWCWTTDLITGGFTPDFATPLQNKSARTFSFSMPDDGHAANRKDVTFAYAEKTFDDGVSDYIDLTFRHPLTNICFEANLDSDDIDIVSIALVGIYRSGDVTFDESADPRFVWSNLSSTGTATETASVSKSTMDKVNFFVIPQDLSSEVKLRVTFHNSRSDETTVRDRTVYNAADPLMRSWKPGSFYKYRLSATTDFTEPILFEVSLVDWQMGGGGDIELQ